MTRENDLKDLFENPKYQKGWERLERSLKAAVPCKWFALCENAAVTTRAHPILGNVPICKRCNDKMDRIEAAL